MVWTTPLPPILVLILATLAVLCPLLLYRHERPARQEKLMALAMVLRMLALVGVLLALLGPGCWKEERTQVRPGLALVLDTSKSMGLVAPGEARTRLECALTFLNQHLPDLSKRFDVDLYEFGSDLRPLQTLSGLKPVQEFSCIRNAAHQATRRGQQPPDAVLILTDGREVKPGDLVSGKDPSVPLFAVGIGGTTAPPDLHIEGVAYESDLPPGTPLVVRFNLVKQGFAAVRTGAVLRCEDRILVRKHVAFTRHETRKSLCIAFTPQESGDLDLTLAVEPLPGEANPENNLEEIRTHIRQRRLRVLLVEGRPRWEFRHLKNSLVRDPNLRLQVLLTGADPGYLQAGSRDAPPLHRFPGKEELARYDLILVGDVDPLCSMIRATYSSEQAFFTALERYVTRTGGGLALLAGPVNIRTWLDAPGLKNVLPVVPEGPGGPWYGETSFHMRLTRAGRQSPLLALLPDPAANADLLEGRPFLVTGGTPASPMPPFLGRARGIQAKPGTEVLATGGDEDAPLFVMTQVGAGRVLFSAIEETWLWRREHEDRFFYRFWRQAVQALAKEGWRTPGTPLVRVDRETVTKGEAVSVEVFPRSGTDPDLDPVADTPDHLLLQSPAGRTTTLFLTPDPEASGHRHGAFTANRIGAYHLRLDSGGTVRARIHVKPPARELDRTDPDPEGLKNWVGISHYADLPDAAALLEILPGKTREVVLTGGLETVWNRLWACVLLVALLTGEWICRMRMRLL